MDRQLIERLQRNALIELKVNAVSSEVELTTGVRDAEILISRHHNSITRSVLEAAPSLRLIIQGTSGLDNIDIEEAARRAIEVVGVPGENANAVAEYVIGCAISLTRTIPVYSEEIRRGAWTRNGCATRRELRSHLLGIIGLGRVGSRVATLAAALGLPAMAYDPYLTADEIEARGAEPAATLPEVLSSLTILTVHVPLTEQTRGMIGEQELSLLRDESIVINAARGPVIQIDPLLRAFASGRLGGLALDVFDEEPPERAGPADPRLILTPHIAGCSGDSKEAIGLRVYEQVERYLRSRAQ